MDYLKKISAQLKGKLKSQQYINANIPGESKRRLLVNNFRGFHLEIDEYDCLYAISIKTYSPLAFSVNSPDVLFSFSHQNEWKGLPYIIYTRDKEHDFLENNSLQKFWISISVLLNNLQLSDFEKLFVYSNRVILVIDSKRDLLDTIDKLITLLAENNNVFKSGIGLKIDASKIPTNLRSLIPLLKKYSISDDSELDQLRVKMTKNQKEKLLNIVDPLMKEIEVYLDSFENKTHTQESMLISNLAELTAELRLS